MEPESPPNGDARHAPAEPARTDLRALEGLRTRVEAAAREIARLRDENEALAARLATLGSEAGIGTAGDGLPAPGTPEAVALRARIEGFIAALDDVLRHDESPSASPQAGAA